MADDGSGVRVTLRFDANLADLSSILSVPGPKFDDRAFQRAYASSSFMELAELLLLDENLPRIVVRDRHYDRAVQGVIEPYVSGELLTQPDEPVEPTVAIEV